MNEFSLKCLGTGDGWPCADRNHASFLYRFGKTGVLIDCGEPTDRSFKANGLGYEAFDGIFLSHLHSDHVGGFFMLMQGCWLERRRKVLPVYLPGKAISPIRQMLRTVFIFDELLSFRLRLMPLRTRQPMRVRDARISAFPTSHLEGFKAHFAKKYQVDFRSYCFLLECRGRRVGHSADLGKPDDLEPLLAKPLDLLVCELAHFSPEAIFTYLSDRRIRRVAFVHLSRQIRDNLPKVRRLAARLMPHIPHTFAADGQELPF